MHSERTAWLRLDAEWQQKASCLFPLIHICTTVILVSIQVVSCHKCIKTHMYDNILHSTGEAAALGEERLIFKRVSYACSS